MLEDKYVTTQLFHKFELTIHDNATKQRVFDIEESPFKVTFKGKETVVFCFSSRFYMKNFVNNIGDTFTKVCDRVTTYLPANSDTEIEGLELMSLLHLYSLIEKRGIKIIMEEGTVKCLDEIKTTIQFSKE